MAKSKTQAASKPAARQAGKAAKTPAKASATKKPVARKPAPRKATAKAQATKAPVSKKAAANKLTAKTTAPKKPAAKKPAAKKPAARKAVAKAPVKKAPAAKAAAKASPAPKPTAPKPTVAKPAAPKPAAPKPAARPVAAKALKMPAGVNVSAPPTPSAGEILGGGALEFLAQLHRKFDARRLELLARRREIQAKLDTGWTPDFLPETAAVRAGDWQVAPLPKDILDRRVEITGPVDRKMVINALNSGASVFMADCEDSSTPTWANMIEGQKNLRDAVRRTISFTDPATQKHYKLNDKVAVLFVRPRGWHLAEKHVTVDGAEMSASLFDFGLYVFHNAREQLDRRTGPYFYLPKMESHLEARLWNDVFVWAQDKLGIQRGTIKATVLIETILASFEMDEILFELREHSAGLNCGRWDYIFSFIKKFARSADRIMPDRAQVTMTTHMMRSYSQLLIRTCHNRGVHAMGGMAAQIPIKDDPAANDAAMAKVRADKEREATDGHDGTWVAHPALVPVAKEIFDRIMPTSNQIHRRRQDVAVTAADLLRVPDGVRTETGLRQNIAIGIGYVEAWLRGIGCVPLNHLMEDAATAEISRAQIWQQLHHGATLEDGRVIDRALFRALLADEVAKIETRLGAAFRKTRFKEAAKMFRDWSEAPRFVEFLTLPAYDWVVAHEPAAG
jgi:malate synthase